MLFEHCKTQDISFGDVPSKFAVRQANAAVGVREIDRLTRHVSAHEGEQAMPRVYR